MSKSGVIGPAGRDEIQDPLIELLRSGARKLIPQAVEAELAEVLATQQDLQLEDGRAGGAPNGYLPKREIQNGIGLVAVRVPKVRAKTGEPVTFHSALVPPHDRTILLLPKSNGSNARCADATQSPLERLF